jgi:hypothetical protein
LLWRARDGAIQAQSQFLIKRNIFDEWLERKDHIKRAHEIGFYTHAAFRVKRSYPADAASPTHELICLVGLPEPDGA